MVRLGMQEQPWKTDSNPAYREMGPSWANTQELCKEIQTVKKTLALQTEALQTETLQIGRGFVSPHMLCKQTGSVNNDSLFREGRVW